MTKWYNSDIVKYKLIDNRGRKNKRYQTTQTNLTRKLKLQRT